MIYVSAVGLINALGADIKEISQYLVDYSQPYCEGNVVHKMILSNHYLLNNEPCLIGRVTANLPEVPKDFAMHNTRNNQLLLAALQQIQVHVDDAIQKYGSKRIAVILGTSTSGIDEGDNAVGEYIRTQNLPESYSYQQQELGDPAIFLADYLGLSGPTYVISTACSSGARAIISGMRLIESGLVDAAIVGGVDSLCRMAINGFHSLESLSSTQCQPFAEQRSGINIGEGAALLLLTRTTARIRLLGVGESSDAYHMSAPHPEGIGAEKAMRMALDSANLQPSEIGYISLHGTATPLNDSAESKAVHRVFGNETPCSSIKHLTGHTLGAAGAMNVGLSWLILTHNIRLPAQDFSISAKDETLAAIHLITRGQTCPHMLDQKKRIILSNAFAFGGNNACVILGDLP